jgi:hypothetical protein
MLKDVSGIDINKLIQKLTGDKSEASSHNSSVAVPAAIAAALGTKKVVDQAQVKEPVIDVPSNATKATSTDPDTATDAEK